MSFRTHYALGFVLSSGTHDLLLLVQTRKNLYGVYTRGRVKNGSQQKLSEVNPPTADGR